MYGVTDFALMRDPKHPAYFVDHTDLIRELEKTRYAMFLRPRRFGKSLICAILQAYYGKDYSDRFEQFFGDLKIGINPTDEHGKYLVLDFDFSLVKKSAGEVQDSFNEIICTRIDKFVTDNAGDLPEGVPCEVLAKTGCQSKMAELCQRLKHIAKPVRLYVIIDEYDNFTNTILAESRAEYESLCHGDGFFKEFFAVLKSATTGVDAPISRMFITGVSPVTMDDVTSGFNIGTNISMEPTFAEFAGFTQDDLREMLGYYRENAGFDFNPEQVRADINKWYDHYRFSPIADLNGKIAGDVCNATLVIGFMRFFLQNRQYPMEMIDENLRTDYRKIRHIITENKKINGNYHKLEEIITNKGTSATLVKSFQAHDIAKGDNFVSLLYYFGLLAISSASRSRVKLRIPNLTIAEFMHDFIGQAYDDLNGIDPRIYDISNGLEDFADNGNWKPVIDTVTSVVSQYWRVRDAVEGERVIQTSTASLIYVAHGPYIVNHELELGGGYADIVLVPQLARYPDIAYALMIELKYFRKDAEITANVLAKTKAEAIGQLDRYAAAHDIAREWNLRQSSITAGVPGGTVSLKRLVIVFKGDERVFCEEV